MNNVSFKGAAIVPVYGEPQKQLQQELKTRNIPFATQCLTHIPGRIDSLVLWGQDKTDFENYFSQNQDSIPPYSKIVKGFGGIFKKNNLATGIATVLENIPALRTKEAVDAFVSSQENIDKNVLSLEILYQAFVECLIKPADIFSVKKDSWEDPSDSKIFNILPDNEKDYLLNKYLKKPNPKFEKFFDSLFPPKEPDTTGIPEPILGNHDEGSPYAPSTSLTPEQQRLVDELTEGGQFKIFNEEYPEPDFRLKLNEINPEPDFRLKFNEKNPEPDLLTEQPKRKSDTTEE